MKQNTIPVESALVSAYIPFASYVNITRSPSNIRDGLKTGGRHIAYTFYKLGLTYDKPQGKMPKVIGKAVEYNPHGPSSILGTTVRMGQDFSMRYPLVEIGGNFGSLENGKDYSADRYLEARGTKILYEMTKNLKKKDLNPWRQNYLEDELIPNYLPTLFPNSLVNGNVGIGVGMASSVPQFNLKEVCNALITLINKSNATFEELYCPVDFATGGTLVNEEQVKISLRNGKGKAAILRGVIEYDEKEHTLIITELPYQVFTNSIMEQLTYLTEPDLETGEIKLKGIKKFYGGVDKEGVKIRVVLEKNVNEVAMAAMLYKHTSVQSHYTIDLTLIGSDGKPRVYNWTEMLQDFLSHATEILHKDYQSDLDECMNQIEILQGLYKATENIDEVIKIIKKSASKDAAKEELVSTFGFSSLQVDVVLKMQLQRLINIERVKIEKDLHDKQEEAMNLREVLENEILFKQKLIQEFERISNEYGDSRRTLLANLQITENNNVVEEKNVMIYLTKKGNLVTKEQSTALVQNRGGKGREMPVGEGDYIIASASSKNTEHLLAYSNKGKVYGAPIETLGEKMSTKGIFNLKEEDGENIVAIMSGDEMANSTYVVLVTAEGIIKKTAVTEYPMPIRKGGVISIKFKTETDRVTSVTLSNSPDDKILLATKNGKSALFSLSEVSDTGRSAQGVIGMKIEEGDYVVSAHLVNDKDTDVISVTKNGLIKRSTITDYPVTGRAVKGVIGHKLAENDELVKMISVDPVEYPTVTIVSCGYTLNTPIEEISQIGRPTMGVKGINLEEGSFVTGLDVTTAVKKAKKD